MKVNTDSMLLGSWAQPGNAKRVLDIGTGSGILALMMAQKASSAAQITAVDIDGLAAAQAAQNFAASPWSTQLQALTGDITSLTFSGRFDVIITNPPYFESVSGDSRAYTTLTTERATARIDDSLSPATLFDVVSRQLTDDGIFYCVYPASRETLITETAEKAGLYASQRLYVSAEVDKQPYLIAWRFKRQRNCLDSKQLAIRDGNGEYTSEFRRLCREFYLKF